MNGNKFLALCLKTQWENGDTCNGCVLADKGVCERMTPGQIAKTRYASMLKRSVAKKEKEKIKNERKNPLHKMWYDIEKARAKNEKAKNYNSLLPEMSR